jgi:Transketolase
MELPTIFVFTHDAMGDGEDGPTHQPVEQLASFRAMPGLVVLRPGDANEVVEAYRYIMQLRTSRPCWRCRVSRCRLWTAANTLQRPGSRAAPMCSATLRAASLR